MKPLFLLPVILCILLFSCQQPADTGSTAAAMSSDPLDHSAMDTTTNPQQDFFQYANGTWLKETVIPSSQSSWGSFSTLFDSSLYQLHGILDSVSGVSNAPAGSVAQLTGDLYHSAMDSVAIERAGITPLKPELDSIDNAATPADLMARVAAGFKTIHSPFFSFYVSADDRNSMNNMPHFDQGGLGLPSNEYYVKTDSASKKIREGYIGYMTKTFQLIGESPMTADRHARDVMQLETALAKASRSPVELRDPVKNYNRELVSDLEKSIPGFGNLLHMMGVESDSILMGQPGFYDALSKLWQHTAPETIKAYLKFHFVDDAAPMLSHDFVDNSFNFNKMLSGEKEERPRWKRMTALVDNQLGDATGQLYVQKYFPPEAKARINELVDNLIGTMGERIQKLDWMSDSTKQKALLKLHAITRKIGYPDKWKDYSSIHISRDNFLANVRATYEYRFYRDIAKINKPVDRTEWIMTPPTVNAYYDPTSNSINFPAGILQPPFFFVHGDDAVNYGAIGMVIGHEMTHGFDDQGRQYDADGNLRDWWDAADVAHFKQRAERIIKEYNGFVAVDTVHINGSLTEGENIADNGGLAIAYAAFQKTAQSKSGDKINGLTPDQRLFLSVAQVWRVKQRDEKARTQALTNPHSTAKWRVNGSVVNQPAFYTAFNVKPGEMMFVPDSLRVKIW